MKKILFTLFSIYYLLFTIPFTVLAATSSASAGNNPIPSDDLTRQIEQKVASTVAKLNLVEKRGFVGIVTDSNDRQITLNDFSGNIRFVDVDEFTKFASPDANSSFGISDIKKGNALGILGLYNKQSRRLLARFVNVLKVPEYITGVVASKDSKNFNILVATARGNSEISIENVSKLYDVDSSGKLIRSGFAKIEVNENIIVSGYFDPKDKTVITAGRVLLFPGVPQNPAIEINIPPIETSSPSIVPSTGSGRKITPIVK